MATMVLNALINGKASIQSARMERDGTVEISIITMGLYRKIVRMSLKYRKSHSEYKTILHLVKPLVPGEIRLFEIPASFSSPKPVAQSFSGIVNILQRRRQFLAVLCPEAA